MKENNNNPLKLEDLDCVLSLSKASKSALKECDEAIPTMERFINQYYCIQNLDLGQVEKDLSKVRAIKEQFIANIGSASISFALYAVIISSIAGTLSDALSAIALALNPSAVFPVSNDGIKIIIFVAALICFGFLLLGFQKRTQDKILVFKCTYMEQYLANYIKKLKEQPEKTQTEYGNNPNSTAQSSQRKETQK